MTQWQPIATAPRNGSRVLLAIPAVTRLPHEGERKQKRQLINGKMRPNPDGMIRNQARVVFGSYINGMWAAGRKAAMAYLDAPTHWMPAPHLPDELMEA